MWPGGSLAHGPSPPSLVMRVYLQTRPYLSLYDHVDGLDRSLQRSSMARDSLAHGPSPPSLITSVYLQTPPYLSLYDHVDGLDRSLQRCGMARGGLAHGWPHIQNNNNSILCDVGNTNTLTKFTFGQNYIHGRHGSSDS